MLHPVPKRPAPPEPVIPDPVLRDPAAIQIITTTSTQVQATIRRLTQEYDIDEVECLLWLMEDVCGHLGIPPLLYPSADTPAPISLRYTDTAE